MLNHDFARQKHEECQVCARGNSTLIPIQHDSYLLNLAAYIQKTAITREAAQVSTEVVNRYRGIGAFWVHRTHSDGRRHGYFIDLAPILQLEIFKKRLVEIVRPWQDVDIELILHPDNEVASKLASMVADELGVTNVIKCNERQLSRLSCGEMDTLLRARRICLVDYVVISGARVYGYRNALNTIYQRNGIERCELYCLVGIARTLSEKALISVSDVVHHSSANPRFLSVECFFLPNWDEKECRWCAELRVLGQLPRDIQDRPLIHNRLQALSLTAGLVDDLFLPWTGGEEMGQIGSNDAWPDDESEYNSSRFWELGPKSVFGDVQSADLAVSVAAAVQRLRGSRKEGGTWRESNLDEVFHSPVAKVLDPELYLAGRYYEPVLVASILRALKPHDIRAPGDDFYLHERIKLLAAVDSSRELHGELVLAAALNQLTYASHNALLHAHPDMRALVEAIFGSKSSKPPIV